MTDIAVTNVRWTEVQGIVLSGYGTLEYSRYLFLNFPENFDIGGWLKQFEPRVTTVVPREGVPASASYVINVAFTWEGLARMGYPGDSAQFSPDFVAGMSHPERARRLGDSGASDPSAWEIGNPGDKDPIHALLLLKAGSVEELDTLGQPLIGGLVVVRRQDGWTSRNDQREHFGFVDGISQPFVEGSPNSLPGISEADSVPTGEFVLGYRNAYGMFPSTPTIPDASDSGGLLPEPVHDAKSAASVRDFGKNGSYLVFRKLRQDVWGFREFLARNAPGAEDWLAAKLLGRWKSGAPLTLYPEADPVVPQGTLYRKPGLPDDFLYHNTDRDGLKCPIGSHIRRANPRDDLEHDAEQSIITAKAHRILRRGVLYGPRLDENASQDDGVERGLLFICVNADIRRQFEFVQQTWLNNPKFGGLRNNRDPIAANETHDMIIQRSPVRQRLKDLPRFVTMRGGGYFFLPGIRALQFLITLGEGPHG